jgi:DNA-binding CsgD family transcriptional regulator
MLIMGAPTPSLVRWGVTPDADLVYRTLRILGRQSVSALSRELGLSPRRINDAVGQLRWIGAIVQTASGDWRAQDPASVVARLEQMARPRARGHAGRASWREIGAELGEDLDVGLRYLRTREATRHRLARLVTVAAHEHLAINPEMAFEARSAAAAAPLDRMLVQRGVAIRALGVAGSAVLDSAAPAAPNAVYREALSVPMKLIVIDRQVAFFPVDPSDYDRGYLEITQPPLLASLVELFEKHWGAATSPPRTGPRVVLSPRERWLVSLLAAGHTDATAGRQMRISRRTVSTIMRQLMDRLGVENRFQLGVVLGAMSALKLEPDHVS